MVGLCAQIRGTSKGHAERVLPIDLCTLPHPRLHTLMHGEAGTALHDRPSPSWRGKLLSSLPCPAFMDTVVFMLHASPREVMPRPIPPCMPCMVSSVLRVTVPGTFLAWMHGEANTIPVSLPHSWGIRKTPHLSLRGICHAQRVQCHLIPALLTVFEVESTPLSPCLK